MSLASPVGDFVDRSLFRPHSALTMMRYESIADLKGFVWKKEIRWKNSRVSDVDMI